MDLTRVRAGCAKLSGRCGLVSRHIGQGCHGFGNKDALGLGMAVHLGFDDGEHAPRFEDLCDALEFPAPGGPQQVNLEFRGEHDAARLSEGCGSAAGGVISHGGLYSSVNETVLLKMPGQEVEMRDTGAVCCRNRFDPEVSDEGCGTEDTLEFVNSFLVHQIPDPCLFMISKFIQPVG